MLRKYAESVELEVLDAVGVPRNAGQRRLSRARRQAHRHHFSYTPRRGYIYVRSRAISSRCNDNFDDFPASEIKTAYRTFVGKPVFVNHHNADHRRARGVIIDAALHEDTNPDGTEDTWAEVLMEVDAVRFPVLAREVLKGNIARTSMGTDVEYSVCTACGNKAYSPADYCQHIPRMKGMKHRRISATTGRTEEVLIAEKCYGLSFFENSLLVEDPADPTAFVLGVDQGEEGISAAAARAVIDEAEGIVRTAGRTALPSAHPDYDWSGGWASPTNGRVFDWGHRTTPSGEMVRIYVGPGGVTRYYNRQGEQVSIDFPDVTEAFHHAETAGWGDPEGVLASKEGFSYDTRHQPYDKKVPGTKPKKEPESESTTIYHRNPEDPKPKGYGGGSDERMRELDDKYERQRERERRQIQRQTPRKASAVEALLQMEAAEVWLLHVHAYGETKAPTKVDTMRVEACPVCGDDESFRGDRCQVCGYVQPPDQFRDPDLSKAREQDLRQEQQEESGLPGEAEVLGDDQTQDLVCDQCGEVFSAEGDPATGTDSPEQEEEVAETDPEHPDDPEEPDAEKADEPDDLSDLADVAEEDLFDDESAEEEGDDEDEVEDPLTEDPAVGEGRITGEPDDEDLSSLKVEVNGTCPICGEGTLVVQKSQIEEEEPDLHEVGTDADKKQHALH